MRYHFLGLLLLAMLNQHCTPTCYRMIYHVNVTGWQLDSTEFREIHLNPLTNHVYTTDLMGQKRRMEAQYFWGFQNSNGTKYRMYAGEIYQVVQEKTLTIYRQYNYGEGFNDDFYFSTGPNERIQYLNSENLKEAFKNDPCMLDLIQKMHPRHWFKSDIPNTFRLLEAYKYCQKSKTPSVVYIIDSTQTFR